MSAVVVQVDLRTLDYEFHTYFYTNTIWTLVPLNLEKDKTKLQADAYNFVRDDPRIDLVPGSSQVWY